MSDYERYLKKQIEAKGEFILNLVFINVPGEGVVTNIKINPEFFPNQQDAAEVIASINKVFVDEMKRIGSLETEQIILQ